MKTAFTLLVFDWDGTLVDSQARIVATFKAAIQAVGLGHASSAAIRNVIGLSLEHAIYHLFPTINAQQYQQFKECYRQYYFAEDTLPTPLFTGVTQTLQKLRATGYWLAVATGKARRGLNIALAEHQLTELFHTTRCADETFSKPHPQMLLEIMDELGVIPEKTVMIGDTEYDLQMAKNAGTAAIAVSYGAHDKPRLLACQPLICLDNLTDLPAYLDANEA
ncbi:HAD-IA family hydrolase [Beggiatoa leptomitoformis]|uniref:HAD-IA family hydrolase n=1 Tax=Beggiatoa leptomitoformis TaxID=288004 RepID=A0A2N9YDB7_9GAMM|nr:HAD-IA family hydrolase [Beggiatoa leptomitoformis]ALG69099.1 HAD-IA family hydrolase [Beggiatoa leptomitoformis]AUI68488.1 HAD-IA family hydrolase [Beggiatoa leptomitoformis]